MENEIVAKIKSSQIGVLRTDTIYGLVGLASSKDADDLNIFDITIDEPKKAFLAKYWPGKISVILKSNNPKFEYLAREHGSLTFRMPDSKALRALIHQTGPLVAPSANPQGLPPAADIQQAKKYFASKVDFYLQGGKVTDNRPSTLADLTRDTPKVLRQGEIIVA